jgi:hypothetical protein
VADMNDSVRFSISMKIFNLRKLCGLRSEKWSREVFHNAGSDSIVQKWPSLMHEFRVILRQHLHVLIQKFRREVCSIIPDDCLKIRINLKGFELL